MNAAAPKTEQFLADLRTASALCRDGDWRRVAVLFKDHNFKPLAYLANAASDVMKSYPHHGIAPHYLIDLCDASQRPQVAELLSIFGIQT